MWPTLLVLYSYSKQTSDWHAQEMEDYPPAARGSLVTDQPALPDFVESEHDATHADLLKQQKEVRKSKKEVGSGD